MNVSSRICQACISQDRGMYSLARLHTILQEINLIEISSVDGSVCWECASAIMKFFKFKRKVQRSRSLLLNCDKLKELLSMSSLGFRTNSGYDYFVEYNYDPLLATVNIKTEEICLNDNFRQDGDYKMSLNDDNLKEEQRIPEQHVFNEEDININVEKDKEDFELTQHVLEEEMFNSSDEIPLVEAKNSINSKRVSIKSKITKKRNKPKKLKNNHSAASLEGNLKKKYVKIVHTEEEMLNKKERKRHGPNFKALPYKCESCVLGFKRKDYYDEHVAKKHDEKVGDFTCPVCSIRFSTQTKLERHKKKHYVCYRCNFCKYETTALLAMLTHCGAKHAADKPGSIHCPHCDVVVKTSEEMSEHRMKEHPLYCDECGETFVSAESLRSHKRRIHNSQRQFLCTLCNKPFRTKLKLESHTASQHAEIAQKLSYCQLCKTQYKNIYVYRNHVRNSALHSQEAHQCTECNRKFASKVYLKKHYNFYHLQKTQYKCDQCSKLFISDYRLKNHKRTQHGVSSTRDYHCNVCGKQFYTQTTLKGHQQIHSERRSYMCEDCGDTFKQRPALYNHHRLVHRGDTIRNKKQTL